MSVDLNHTIVWSRDAAASARFLTEIMGIAPPGRFGRFHTVETGNGVSLDYADTDRPITSQHYAFLVDESDFDQVFARITGLGLDYWRTPAITGRARSTTATAGAASTFQTRTATRLRSSPGRTAAAT